MLGRAEAARGLGDWRGGHADTVWERCWALRHFGQDARRGQTGVRGCVPAGSFRARLWKTAARRTSSIGEATEAESLWCLHSRVTFNNSRFLYVRTRIDASMHAPLVAACCTLTYLYTRNAMHVVPSLVRLLPLPCMHSCVCARAWCERENRESRTYTKRDYSLFTRPKSRA